MPGKKILVVDDDKAIHAALRAILAKTGHQVISALDAMQGPMMAKQHKPDLIILDITMPAGGGFSVYERLRTFNTDFQTPILVYTSMPLDDVKARIPESPETAFLAKPAAPEAIVAAVAGLLPAA